MASQIAETRLWRSKIDLAQFRKAVDDWLKQRRGVDPFQTSLDAIYREVTATADKLAEYLRTGDGKGIAEAYGIGGRFDTALGWLRRVFAFFQEKIDQRNGPFGSALRAADEVIWSSFRTFEGAGKEPAPLAFIDAQYSPAAIRRDRSLASLVDRGSGFEFLSTYLKTLPIPVLRLPLAVVDAPWMLVVIGHEVGHFVQPLVAAQYADTFAALVEKTAIDGGASSEDAKGWANCAGEIFADWYSIGVIGPWALWAMAQFEVSDDAAMRERRFVKGYPSAVARLELLRQLADALSPQGAKCGSAVAATLGVSLAPSAQSTAAETQDRAVAEALATLLAKQPLGAHGPLALAVGYDAAVHAEDGEVALWAGALTGKFGRDPKKELQEARYIAAASARVFAQAKLADDAAREAFTTSLRKTTLNKITESAVEGKRANEQAIEIYDAGEQLSSLLLGLDLPAERPA